MMYYEKFWQFYQLVFETKNFFLPMSYFDEDRKTLYISRNFFYCVKLINANCLFFSPFLQNWDFSGQC